MPLSKSLQAIAFEELHSGKCQGCQGTKTKNRSFCPNCYHRLPLPMRRELYKSFGEGYATAYDEAKDWLKQNQ